MGAVGNDNVDKIITSGASLASLLHSVATAPTDFDGLLLGRVVRKTKALTTDETEFGETETTEAFLSGFLCNGGMCSFYTPLGDINEATVKKLQNSNNGSNILGWFVYRAGMGFSPTMRERRVCQQFYELRKATGLPVIFGVVSSCRQHAEATTTFQLKVHQQIGEMVNGQQRLTFRPVKMRVDNIGTTISHKAYDDVSHLCIIPYVPSYHTVKGQKERQKTGSSTDGDSTADSGGGKLHQLAVEGVYSQVQGIEELYKNILRKVDSLSREVCSSSAELCMQLQKVRALESALQTKQSKLSMQQQATTGLMHRSEAL